MHLIPRPKRLRYLKEGWTLPRKGLIHASGDLKTAEAVQRALPAGWTLTRTSAPERLRDAVCLLLDPAADTGDEGYRLRCDGAGVEIRARTERGLFYGAQTLLQILRQHRHRLPGLAIADWPDFADRGVYYDVTRGRVPKLERLFELADRLAHYKINQLQLYVEHVFSFRKHPKIGRGASPLTAEDILRLDAYCRERYIELVPSLQSFGHMSNITKWAEYKHLCEDDGRCRYVEPPKVQHRLRGWTLSPAVPETYKFIDELYEEFLPLFSSKRFNACCDEVYDLGCGKSHSMCKKLGKGRVYLNHLLKLRKSAARHGKEIMFWGDILLKYPELIREMPKDVTLLNWGYRANYKFETCKLFDKAGRNFYCCPGTSSWVSLFPRVEESRENIRKFAAMGRETLASGLLNTDWGDGGHYNFMEYSWYGFLFGAEQAWNTNADTDTFDRRFSTLFFGDSSGKSGTAVRRLGQTTMVRTEGYYQSRLRHAYFLPSGDELFTKVKAKTAGPLLRKAEAARKVFAAAGRAGGDPSGTRPYLVFAAKTTAHAAKRIAAFGVGGKITAAQRRKLGREYEQLRRRFIELWHERNRPSEIGLTLNYYDTVAKADYGKR